MPRQLNEPALHLVDDIPYVQTLCGRDLSTVADDCWTDALTEIVEAPPSETCRKCLKAARARLTPRARTMDMDWIREQAMQNGMAFGIQGYNDTLEAYSDAEQRELEQSRINWEYER